MKRHTLVVLAALLLPCTGLAQAARVLEDKKAIHFNQIERGLFFEVQGGFWGLFNPPASATSKRYFSPGQTMQIEVGYDIGERISPFLLFQVATNRAGSDYTGLSNGVAAGDFGLVAPGAGVRGRLVGFDDGQDVKRTWVYVRAAVGLVFYNPQLIIPTRDILISAGPGVEYFTRLRHFSISAEADLNVLVPTATVGMSVLVSVRYAFDGPPSRAEASAK